MADGRRARSFGAAADAYAAHRPGYPDSAVEWALAPAGPDARVLDLAAGTGKLTACLLDRAGLTVTAVEPDPAMLGRLRKDLPSVDARAGSAEDIPLDDASVDAVLVGQAMHWFDPARAFPEIARVLRPGGVLAGLWNGEDAELEWIRGYNEALHGAPRTAASSRGGDGATLEPGPDFTGVEVERFPHGVRTTVDGLVETLATHSWALVAGPAERDAAFARMRAYLAGRPEAAAGGFTLPLVTLTARTLRR
ncbi:MAG: class I SAM-dependent methyltransferase [Pseudonocardia sp.]|nr:class I SAM-dependent methyltransferase [Pseudonocardia sp.]